MNTANLKNTALRLFLRRFRLAVGLLCLVVVVVGYLLFIQRKITEVRTVGISGLRVSQNELVERQQYRDRLKAMIGKFESDTTDADRELLNRAIPQGPQIPNLLAVIDDLAKQSGFTLQTFVASDDNPVAENSPTVTADQSGILGTLRSQTPKAGEAALGSPLARTLNLRVSLQGPSGYDALKKFLTTIESSVRLFDVRTLDVVIGGKISALGEAEKGRYDLTLQTPYLIPAAH